MKAIGFNTGNKRCKRQARRFLSPLRVGVFLMLTLLLGSAPLYAVKPAPKVPKLDSALCPQLGGTWEVSTCTIADGSWGQATSDFLIPGNVSLVIRGDGAPTEPSVAEMGCTFVIGFGVTLENDGLIRIETSGDWGFCNLGTLKNAGTIDVANIWQADQPYWGMVNLSTVTNSGTITVKNVGGSWAIGIFNAPHIPADQIPWTFDTILPTITNTGTIVIENNGDLSTGILNDGAISNSGNITVNAGIVGYYGLNNQGAFTNEAAGTLVNYYGDFSLVPRTYGVANFDGTMINYGSVTNEGVIGTDGWAMLTYGTLDNHGILLQSDGVLVNYGTIHNWGGIFSDGDPDYPHNEGVCENLPNEDGTLGSGC